MAALSLYLLLTWIFLLSLFRTRFAEVLCHADESSALMEFKRSFRTNAIDWRCVNPKVHSWSLDGSGDCCSWDGVKCDEVTSRVIALDLSSSCLSGTMNPNTTLFRLIHVESLNLAFNSFNFSSIPYGFGNLSKLQYLNLSTSDFSGEIPHDIWQLSKLVSLDLSCSTNSLRMANMAGFVHNLTGLKELDLSSVSLSSPFPPMLANFSSLTLLRLEYCRLSGNFPVSIFQLPNLEVLSVAGNSNLSVFFPKLHWGSANMGGFVHNLTWLKELDLSSVSLSSPFLPMLANFSSLTLLRLEYCRLSGNFPVSIFQLPNLEVLSVAGNSNLSVFFPKLHWGSPLKSLYLYRTNFSGEIPTSIGNLSLLNELSAWGCYFSRSLPSSIGNLSHLIELDLDSNNLQGQIPISFANLNQLSELDLSYNNLSGDSLEWMVNLTKLTVLDISGNRLNGGFPSSFENLKQLTYLDLSGNDLHGDILGALRNLKNLDMLYLGSLNLNGILNVNDLFTLKNLTTLYLSDNNISFTKSFINATTSKLTYLYLDSCNLTEFPRFIGYLSELEELSLRHNRIQGNWLSGGFPSSFENLKQLTYLDLSGNDLHGDILGALRNLKGLQVLYLESLNLNGVLDVNDLFTLKNLEILFLSYNNISFTKSFINATKSKLTYLHLNSCNLTELPQFIGYLSKLERLYLQHNRIQGTIPRWIWNNSKESLRYVDLSQNLLTGFKNNLNDLPLPNLLYFDVSSNLLETNLPIPPPLVKLYNISNNVLFGDIPTSICKVSSLVMLDLSNNALNGTLPSCLGSISPLILLNLARNKFNGMIPHGYPDDCALRMIDLRENQLSGIVPRSLGNCKMLEYLNLGDNQINDTFPFWLSELAYLKAIGLRSNSFHGPIESNLSQLNFTSLHILDISNNNFNGEFPFNLLKSCQAMKVMIGQDELAYLNIIEDIHWTYGSIFEISMTYAMKLMNKGTKREYAKIPEVLMAIDLSNNKFEGFIPKLIGDLKSLRMLNLSNNLLNGSIPPSLANLTVLEALDLSRNNLVGEIPQQLARLTFLSVFDVSHNHLSGPIPRGTQFDTFESSSFVMNNGLCGSPLPNKCTNGENTPPPPSYFKVDDEEECLFNLDWRIVLVGTGVGFSVGIVMENLIIDEKRMWFLCCSKKMAKNWKNVRKGLADKKICS